MKRKKAKGMAWHGSRRKKHNEKFLQKQQHGFKKHPLLLPPFALIGKPPCAIPLNVFVFARLGGVLPLSTLASQQPMQGMNGYVQWSPSKPSARIQHPGDNAMASEPSGPTPSSSALVRDFSVNHFPVVLWTSRVEFSSSSLVAPSKPRGPTPTNLEPLS
eukprot:CAMPEP_0198246414 /NCGR_PEP_ID=MMETSP1446-20131203/45960_1 /TAXON_ID=1461542 ORGANISM="Unidentified sp, Strain CCMP2111" /NCGR_SAMPLE_ID=MMETSP1446 /ASSEMBLY_ACC=CAM_ASM_001112 /LENGTH=159 /DNA_ID=CAMNT_0043930735 /DNA_START=852 /DNA_END=1330 /DNA_ORIENTATION=-